MCDYLPIQLTLYGVGELKKKLRLCVPDVNNLTDQLIYFEEEDRGRSKNRKTTSAF